MSLQQEGEAGKPSPADSIYRHAYSDTGFRTAGMVFDEALERYYAVWSFEGGPYVCFTVFKALRPGKLNWTGMPVYFYVRPGLTSTRRYHDAEGNTELEKTLSRKSDWWCVADAIGLLATGGNGQIRV